MLTRSNLSAFGKQDRTRSNPTKLNGLVLIGGKSTRMGRDKSAIHYHGKAHRLYLADLLLEVGCEKVYYSCNTQQFQTIEKEYPKILDQYPDSGPMGALLSAFEVQKDRAWFVLGCDYPLLDLPTLNALLTYRHLDCDVTLFRHPKSQFLEPLVAIYKPSSYSKLYHAFQNKERSLQRTLEKMNINVLALEEIEVLINVNDEKGRKDFLKEKPS